ncbi:hypothetical protein CEXT_93051 [Caerostris extrusa]|uniref:Uncharacterized protein n=1 Tax=Caerostris extrusa TaxID=172846 RepID=A0AAV4QWW5_CAEEX|nr:hypothetical protein CEXT_93051 [Caerostris extrusa]
MLPYSRYLLPKTRVKCGEQVCYIFSLKVRSTKTPSQIQNSVMCPANSHKILWIVGRETVPLGDRRGRQVEQSSVPLTMFWAHPCSLGQKESGILKRSAHPFGYFTRPARFPEGIRPPFISAIKLEEWPMSESLAPTFLNGISYGYYEKFQQYTIVEFNFLSVWIQFIKLRRLAVGNSEIVVFQISQLL